LLAILEIEGYNEAIELTKNLFGENFKVSGSEKEPLE
jgi:hypothetical protein